MEQHHPSKLKSTLMAIVMLLGIFSLIALIVWLVLRGVAPDLLSLLEDGDQSAIEAYVRSAGNEGLLIIFILQYLQALSIVLPAIPIQITAGIVYGVVRGTITCHLAFLAGNMTVFSLARRLSGSAVRELLGGDSKLALIAKSNYPAFMVVVASMIPIVPNGIIPYAAAASNVSAKGFCKGVALGSFPSILIFCAVGHNILSGEYVLAGILCVLETVLVVVMMCNQDAIIHRYIHLREQRRALFTQGGLPKK